MRGVGLVVLVATTVVVAMLLSRKPAKTTTPVAEGPPLEACLAQLALPGDPARLTMAELLARYDRLPATLARHQAGPPELLDAMRADGERARAELQTALELQRKGERKPAEDTHAEAARQALREARHRLAELAGARRPEAAETDRALLAIAEAADPLLALLEKTVGEGPAYGKVIDDTWRERVTARLRALAARPRSRRAADGAAGRLLLAELALYRTWMGDGPRDLPIDLLALEADALWTAGDLDAARERYTALAERDQPPAFVRPWLAGELAGAKPEVQAAVRDDAEWAQIAELRLLELALEGPEASPADVAERALTRYRELAKLPRREVPEALADDPLVLRSQRMHPTRLLLDLRTLALLLADQPGRATRNERLIRQSFPPRPAAEFTAWIESFYTADGKTRAIATLRERLELR